METGSVWILNSTQIWFPESIYKVAWYLESYYEKCLTYLRVMTFLSVPLLIFKWLKNLKVE